MFEHVHLDHVVLRVVDVARMTDFYRAVLGARVERELDIGLVQLRAGDILIDLVPVDSELGRQGGPPPGPGRNLDHFCLRVEPFDEAVVHAHLERFGAPHTEAREVYGAEGFGPSIYVTDPEGNVMELKGRATRTL
jgi:glyoxylase I family protein